MSTPVSSCLISKAALGDQQAFEWLVEVMEYNRSQVCYTIFPCKCDPPCQRPADEQQAALQKRVDEAIRMRAKERAKNRPAQGLGSVPDFSKWIFPVIKNMRTRKLLPWYRRFWNWVRRKPDLVDDDLRKILTGKPLMTKTTKSTEYYHEK